MSGKKNMNIIAVSSILIIIVMICSTQFAFLAGAQTGYGGGGGYGGNYGQQAPSGGGPNFLSIPGLEGLQGFMPGENRLSLSVIPVSQQGNQLGFQVVGFAISSQQTGAATVYSLSQPLAGVIDQSQNTLQVDLSNLANNVNQAGYVPADQVYNSLRADPKIVVIDVDMSSQGVQGSQAIFNVNSVSIIPPDGKMQAFSMQQPTQLIIDSQSMRIYMVAFPQMVNTFSNFYGASFPQVLPIAYVQPIPITPPVFVPYLTPFPIFFPNFIPFHPFVFRDGFRPFFDRDRDFGRFHGQFPIREHNFGFNEFNEFRRTTGINAGIGREGSAIGREGTQFNQPSGITTRIGENERARAGTGVGNIGAIGNQPGAGAGAGMAGREGFANVRTPTGTGAGVNIGNIGNQPGAGAGMAGRESFANVQAPRNVGGNAGVGSQGIAAGNVPTGAGRGLTGGQGFGMPSAGGAEAGSGIGANVGGQGFGMPSPGGFGAGSTAGAGSGGGQSFNAPSAGSFGGSSMGTGFAGGDSGLSAGGAGFGGGRL